ncbi:helix-turn-helix domain-containing protein [Virgibacillus byunsanensis]|uniref:Helix-turn-helix domain-containing protein n=1 Tax=Virgibacillus byunsanensis TaxID=570945 RepID=A0ABW3LID4_9BACI
MDGEREIVLRNKQFCRLFGEYIREAREARGDTLEKLADDAGIDTSTIERIERGVSDPRNSTVFKLEKVLEINIHNIYKEISEKL